MSESLQDIEKLLESLEEKHSDIRKLIKTYQDESKAIREQIEIAVGKKIQRVSELKKKEGKTEYLRWLINTDEINTFKFNMMDSYLEGSGFMRGTEHSDGQFMIACFVDPSTITFQKFSDSFYELLPIIKEKNNTKIFEIYSNIDLKEFAHFNFKENKFQIHILNHETEKLINVIDFPSDEKMIEHIYHHLNINY